MKKAIFLTIFVYGISLASNAQCNRFLNEDSGYQTGRSLGSAETYPGENWNIFVATFNKYSSGCWQYAMGGI